MFHGLIKKLKFHAESAAQRDQLPDYREPFPDVSNCQKWHVISLCESLSSLALWGGKMRDPGNEVGETSWKGWSLKSQDFQRKVQTKIGISGGLGSGF